MTDNSDKVDINGYPIWYERFGRGPKPVLLIPGGIGTGRTDYWPQLDGEDALDTNRFTFIAVEPPGWGRSTPPVRRYDKNMYNRDADCYHQLMQHLGYQKYSVVGWSDGAKSGLTLAIKYADSVSAMVLSGASICGTKEAVKYLQSMAKIDGWTEDRLKCYLRSYETKDKIQNLWTKYVRSAEYYEHYFGKDMFDQDQYYNIKCPVVLIFGEKDQMTTLDQSLHLSRCIRYSKLMRFPSAGHDFHQQFATKFKIICEDLFWKA